MKVGDSLPGWANGIPDIPYLKSQGFCGNLLFCKNAFQVIHAEQILELRNNSKQVHLDVFSENFIQIYSMEMYFGMAISKSKLT